MKADKTKTPAKRLNTRKPESKPRSPKPVQMLKRSSGVPPSTEEVATAAYYNYLNDGRPQGQALRHWLDAEAQIASRYSGDGE